MLQLIKDVHFLLLYGPFLQRQPPISSNIGIHIQVWHRASLPLGAKAPITLRWDGISE